MCVNNFWSSPDNRIKKNIVADGKWGQKPWESSECKINISKCSIDVKIYNDATVVIGENDTNFGRLLDNCLTTMCKGEIADVTFSLQEDVSFRLHLTDFTFKGYIFEWSPNEKFNLALKHKNKGVELFKTQYIDASHRFSKALKILSSIPIDVENPPIEIDGITLDSIKNLKATLYNNLAACFLKNKNYENVIELSKKVLQIDSKNAKALYKISIAYIEDNDYEHAQVSLKDFLEIEPDNKIANDKLKFVNMKLSEAESRVNEMFKKMFVN